jgi:hypothetical protein
VRPMRERPGNCFNGLLGSFGGGSFFRLLCVWLSVAGCGVRGDGFAGRLGGAGVVCCSEVSGLELLEAEEGSGDLAVEGDFVAQEEFVGAHTFGGASESEDGSKGRRFWGGFY